MKHFKGLENEYKILVKKKILLKEENKKLQNELNQNQSDLRAKDLEIENSELKDLV